MSIEFKISDAAVEKIKGICEKENKPGHGLRVQAEGGGCGGPQVRLALDEKADEKDVVIEMNGIKIFIDPQTAEFVNNSSLDYIDSPMGGGFKLNNPNAPEKKEGGGGGCGCGSGGGSCGCGAGGCGS